MKLGKLFERMSIKPYPQGSLLQPYNSEHFGIDLYAVKGTPLLAPANCTVSSVGNNGVPGGNQVILHFQEDNRLWEIIYGHLDTIKVSDGQALNKGDVIGTIGNTGQQGMPSPVPQWGNIDPSGERVHVHFDLIPYKFDGLNWNPEFINNGLQGHIDPLPYFEGLTEPPAQPQGYTYLTFREKYLYSPPGPDNAPFAITDANFDSVRNSIPSSLWPTYDAEFKKKIIYSQRDPRWANDQMGKSRCKLGDFGCLLVSYSMLAGIDPGKANKLAVYTIQGLLIHDQTALRLGLKYNPERTKPLRYPCIGETRLSGHLHFVVVDKDGSQRDPWSGTVTNKYKILSWRNLSK